MFQTFSLLNWQTSEVEDIATKKIDLKTKEEEGDTAATRCKVSTHEVLQSLHSCSLENLVKSLTST